MRWLQRLTSVWSGWRNEARTKAELAAFQRNRRALEEQFYRAAAESGKPRGLQWDSCFFQPQTLFLRDRNTGESAAFVEVTIAFSAVEGGGMENVQAVSNLRRATAVFHCHKGQWGAGGRALFNLTPEEAARHFAAQYEALPETQ